MANINIIEQTILPGNDFDGAYPTGAAATGTITAPSGAQVVEGESFFLKDGHEAPDVEFRFTLTEVNFPISGVLRPIVYLPGDSADDMRVRILSAINNYRGINLFASLAEANVINLINREVGTRGNHSNLNDAVANPAMSVSTMSGGVQTSFVDYDDTRVYTPHTSGGLFDFPWAHARRHTEDQLVAGGVGSWLVERMTIDAGNATSFTVYALTPDNELFQLATGSGLQIVGPFELDGLHRLQLVTAGASSPMYARVCARPMRIINS